MKAVKVLLLLSLLLPIMAAADMQITGSAALEYRYFNQKPLFETQHSGQMSAFIEPEIYHSWNDDLDSITFKPYYRWDQQDSERSHGDIRELMWLHVGDDWELRSGVGFVYWGQTESQHLVDVINQTDGVESLDGEDKLGQLMMNLTLIREWGNLDLFILPGFRERTFAGEEGRLRPQLLIEQDDALYESGAKQKHLDWAARWTHTIDDWDVGLSYFDGTSRDPSFVPTLYGDELKLRPYYSQMQQIGVDALAVLDDWLYKFEGIYRDTEGDGDYFAVTAGFEYTSVGVFESVMDIGWLMEYQFDDRDEMATSPGQNDLMLGSRLALNDVNGTDILIGVVQDLDDSDTRSGFIEASSRINDNWKWRLEAWIISNNNPNKPSYVFRQDDYAQFSLEYYF